MRLSTEKFYLKVSCDIPNFFVYTAGQEYEQTKFSIYFNYDWPQLPFIFIKWRWTIRKQLLNVIQCISKLEKLMSIGKCVLWKN